ncbi:MAG: hypothetical protein ACR2Q3_01190 [Woeseiaceae bacterium]
MNNQSSDSGGWAARTTKNTLNLAYWTGAWLVSMAVATFGPILVWQENRALTALMIAVNIAIGAGMIAANKRHLQGLDEMQQKIQLEAMALSLGVALVAGLGYSMLDVANVIPFDAEISHLVVLVGLTYGAGVVAGLKRYQ